MSGTPYPHFLDRPVAGRWGINAEWGERGHLGYVRHRAIGTGWGTDSWYRIYTTGGLTEWIVMGALDGADDGLIIRFVDAFNTNVVPYSSGGSDGLEGPGVDFYRQFGPKQNHNLEAIELSGLEHTQVTAKQLASTIHLQAAITHRSGFEADSLAWWDMEHYFFAVKACPFDVVRGLRQEIYDATIQTMRHFEGASVSDQVRIGGIVVDLPFDARPIEPTPPPDHPIQVTTRTFKARAVTGAVGRRNASIASDENIRKRFKPGEVVGIRDYVIGATVHGSNRWFLTSGAQRLRVHESGLNGIPAAYQT